MAVKSSPLELLRKVRKKSWRTQRTSGSTVVPEIVVGSTVAPEIVVGIDFGTTYSGVSWATDSHRSIRVINDWPNLQSPIATSDKVPSRITYRDGVPHHWGFNVDAREGHISFFKLLLDSDNAAWRGSNQVLDGARQLQILAKTPEDAAADYLQLLWEHTKNEIGRVRGDNAVNEYNLKVVIALPAMWSQAGLEKIAEIARKARLPGNVSFISEPEAAALAVLRNRSTDGEPLRRGDCFVVCDAGSATVDLVSYEIKALSPLQLEECTIGDGGLCGSNYLDQAFERYIRTIVGESQWQRLKPRSKRKMMQEFDLSVKRCYNGDNQHFSVELLDVEDDPAVGIDDEMIDLTPAILKSIFDHVINQVLRLVGMQVDDIEERGKTAKAILLVGGFGTNRYMYRQLHEFYEGRGVRILQTDSGWSAVCRGATMWGLERSNSQNHAISKPAHVEPEERTGNDTYNLETGGIESISPPESIANGSVTLVEPSVFSAQHQAFSTDATLVNDDSSIIRPATFTVLDYQSHSHVQKYQAEDLHSIVSRDDVSQAGTTASMLDYQDAATGIIAKALLDDEELVGIYNDAIKRVGRERFLRNNRKLLQGLSKDLKTSQLLPSELMATRFLSRQQGSQLVCAAICYELAASETGLQSRLEPNENKKMMLERYLYDIDHSVQPGDSDPVPGGDDSPVEADDAFSLSGDSDDMVDEGFDEEDEQPGREKLKATVGFIVSGEPFQAYKQRLYEWLQHPLLGTTGSESKTPIGKDAPSRHSSITSKEAESIFTVTSTYRARLAEASVLALPLLVHEIMQSIPLQREEIVVPKGRTRVIWKAGCRYMFDDYIEVDSGAATELQEALKKRYQAGTGEQETTPRSLRSLLNLFSQRAQQQSRPDAEQGEQDRSSTHESTHTINAETSAGADGKTKLEALRLLLCVDDGRAKATLKQETLLNINDDRDLFTYLRKQYFTKRTWFALRCISAVSLAQFEVNYSNATNVYHHEIVCTITSDEHLDRDLGYNFCLCIPPEERVGQDKEYLCDPAPRSRSRRRLVPVLGPRLLKGDFLSPHLIAAGQRTTLKQLPKRLGVRGELRATPDDLAIGWGLHLQEDWHWPTIYFCFLVIVLFSLLFGIVWSVRTSDIQGAFAVAGFVLTLGAMFLGYMAIPNS